MIEAFQKLSLTSSQYYTQLSTSQFSQRLIDSPPIKKLDSIIVTNFKSFKGKVYVGPLLNFTSIIGPNGAGKSNILDALMFCLCNEKSKLTFYDLRQFIQRDGNETYSEMQKKDKYTEVEANFIIQTGQKLTFKRTLYPNQAQEFSIDGEDYPQKVYQHFLIRCNLNCITSNYAIWQGQVDKLIIKNPKELTAHLQNISGSVYFKKQQEQLKGELEEVEQFMQNEASKMVKLRLQKKNIKKLNTTKDTNLKIQQEYQYLLKKLFMIKMYLSQLQIKQSEKELESIDKEEKKKIKELNQNKVKMQREQTEKIDIQNHMNRLMKEIAQANTHLKTLQHTSSNLIDAQTLKELQNEIVNLKKYASNLGNRQKELQNQSQAYQSLQVDKQYLSLYSKWQRDNQVMNKELTKQKNQYLYNQQILNTKQAILQEFKQKSQRISKNIEDEQHRKGQIQSNISQLDKNISRMKTENGRMSQDFINNRNKLQEIQGHHNIVNERIIQLESLMVENIQNEKDKQLIQKLSSVEGFKGLIEQWVKPAAKKYQLCFHAIMISTLKYILCADQNSSKHIAVKLRQNGQIRNLIILGNVNSKKEQISRASLGKLGQLALDAMQFDKSVLNLEQFLKEYLSGKIICDNLAAAWSLLSQNIRGIKEIYTLDGNVLRNDGVISTFGSADAIKNKYKYISGSKSRTLILDQIQGLQKQKSSLQASINELKQKVSNEKIQKCNIEIRKLQSRKQELLSNLNLIKKGLQTKKEVKIPKGLEKQIEQAKQKVEKIRESMKEIQKQMLNSKIFTDFIMKNKINNLDSFRSLEDLSSLESKVKNRNRVIRQIEQIQRESGKIDISLVQKQEKFNKLKQKLSNTITQEQKVALMHSIKKGEEQLANLRNRLSKMNNINMEGLKFKSQLPHIQAKISLLRERHQKFVKAETAILGLEKPPENHQYKELQENLGTTLTRATKEIINETYQSLLKQSKDLQSQLQKHHLDISNFNEQVGNANKIEQEIQTISQSLKQLTDRKMKINQKLENVKRDRKNMFMNFFNNLRPILQDTYQKLTKNNDGISGKVDLYLQNDEFPCDDGVYFYPTPPTKRLIYQLDQLSGGQKSIASLSLQYSIAKASKSPFLILDQIDAFLDGTNVLKFVKMIHESIEQNSLQFILITHKRSLFLKGQSLVGVTKSQPNPFSRAYSLLLQEEDENK